MWRHVLVDREETRVMMMVNMLPQAMDKWEFNEVTMTLGINRFVHWIPIIFGFAMSIIGTAWVLLHYLRPLVARETGGLSGEGPKQE